MDRLLPVRVLGDGFGWRTIAASEDKGGVTHGVGGAAINGSGVYGNGSLHTCSRGSQLTRVSDLQAVWRMDHGVASGRTTRDRE